MAESATVTTTQHIERDLGLEDLRAGILTWVAIACWVVAGGLIAYLPAISVEPMTENWALGSAVFVVGALAWWMVKSNPRAAASFLTLALLTCGGAALYLYPGSTAACALSLVVIVASVVVGPRAGLAVALVTTVGVLAVAQPPNTIIPGDVAVMALFLIWANATLAYLSSRPLHAALQWAWGSFAQAQDTIEQLRDSRGELGRVSKSLEETCVRLAQLNAELDRARRVAEEARRHKSEFATAVSHELRTPLNLIIGFSEMMIVSPESSYGERLPETYREDVEAIYRSAAHISHLVDDILDLSQIEAHRLGLHKERASLARLVDEVFATIGSLYRDKGLYLRAEVAPDLPRLHVDPTRVRQVLLNLLSNAVRFTDDGGVGVTAECRGHEVVVSVDDTGSGISPEDLPLVFEEFRQMGGDDRRLGGSGLGLAVSKRLVELHGGTMWVESAVGEGSTFCFTLPLNEAVVASPFDRSPDVWDRLRTTADDEPVLAVLDESHEGEVTRILQRYLDRTGVVGVRSFREARRVAEDGKLSGLLMASADGTQRLLDRARKEFPELPIVCCSFQGLGAPFRELGAQDYLVKPISREQLQSALRELGVPVRKVLIVDDDPAMVHLLTEMVRSRSRRYTVWGASGGVEGLSLLREVEPDVVILDLLMPDLDGYTFLAEMRGEERFREVPVVVVTARGYEEQSVRVGAIEITRAGGLTVGQAARCISTSLEILTTT